MLFIPGQRGRDLCDRGMGYAAPPVISCLDFSPDGSLLAVSGYHEVLLPKADGARLVARLIGLAERIESVAFSPDGSRLAVTGGAPARMGEVQIWNVPEQTLIASAPVTYDTVYGASWSPDGKSVAFGCTDNSVRAMDAETGTQVLLQRAPTNWTLDTTFSRDGSHVVSVGRDMTVKLTELKTQRFVDNITSITPGALKGGILAVDRHPSRDEVLVGGDDGIPRTYRIFRETARRIGDDSNLVRRFPALPGRIFDVAYSPDGRHVVAASSDNGVGHVHYYAADYNGEIPDNIAKIESKTVGERAAEERAELARYHESGVRLVAKMAAQEGSVYAVAIRSDGQMIASGGFDGRVRLNDANTGTLIKEFVLSELRVHAAPEGKPDDAVAVPFTGARATFSQPGHGVAKAIDGDLEDVGWAVAPQLGRNHTAIFETETDVGQDGTAVLSFELHHAFGNGTYSIGRFRVLATSSMRPLRLVPPAAELLAIVNTPPDHRTDDQRAQLLSHYRKTDARLRELEEAAAASQRAQADQRLVGAQDITWALVNSTAFLFNR